MNHLTSSAAIRWPWWWLNKAGYRSKGQSQFVSKSMMSTAFDLRTWHLIRTTPKLRDQALRSTLCMVCSRLAVDCWWCEATGGTESGADRQRLEARSLIALCSWKAFLQRDGRWELWSGKGKRVDRFGGDCSWECESEVSEVGEVA